MVSSDRCAATGDVAREAARPRCMWQRLFGMEGTVSRCLRSLSRVIGGDALLSPLPGTPPGLPGYGCPYRVPWPDDPQVQLAQGNYKCVRLLFDPVLA